MSTIRETSLQDDILCLYEKMINNHYSCANRIWLANFGAEYTGPCLLSRCENRGAIAEYNREIRELSMKIRTQMIDVSYNDIAVVYLAFNALLLRGEIIIDGRDAFSIADNGNKYNLRNKITIMSNMIDKVMHPPHNKSQ